MFQWSNRTRPGTLCHTSATSSPSRTAKIRASNPRDKTVHIECAVSQVSRHQTRILNYLHSSTQRSNWSNWSNRPKPGTLGHTSAISLPNYKSKNSCQRPQRQDGAHKMCRLPSLSSPNTNSQLSS